MLPKDNIVKDLNINSKTPKNGIKQNIIASKGSILKNKNKQAFELKGAFFNQNKNDSDSIKMVKTARINNKRSLFSPLSSNPDLNSDKINDLRILSKNRLSTDQYKRTKDDSLMSRTSSVCEKWVKNTVVARNKAVFIKVRKLITQLHI